MRLADFEGGWRIARTITEPVGTSRLSGRADFVRTGQGLAVTETGTLVRHDGASFRASRRYRWTEAAGRILVAFDDGRPFHDFSCDAPRPAASHDCPPDRYTVAYDFAAWPAWSATWRVTGPRKDYTLITRFARLDSTAQLRQDEAMI